MAHRVTLSRYTKRLWALVRHPFFWALTVVGNAIILLGAIGFYAFESRSGMDFLDCLLWSAGTVTTIGYGNFMVVTTAGKITLLGLMLLGTLFVWTYMAFLVTGLIAPELSSIERDVHDVEKELRDLKES